MTGFKSLNVNIKDKENYDVEYRLEREDGANRVVVQFEHEHLLHNIGNGFEFVIGDDTVVCMPISMENPHEGNVLINFIATAIFDNEGFVARGYC